jgi:hypothetical protein
VCFSDFNVIFAGNPAFSTDSGASSVNFALFSVDRGVFPAEIGAVPAGCGAFPVVSRLRAAGSPALFRAEVVVLAGDESFLVD